MERIQQGFSTTVSQSIIVGTTAATAATVTVVRDDGTILVNGAAATPVSNGLFTYSLAAAQTSLLDRLEVRFTSTAPYVATLTQVVEVAGGHLFELSQLESHPDVKRYYGESAPPREDLEDARIWAEQRFEGVCNFAFVPRYGRKRWSLRTPQRLMPYLRSIRTLSVTQTGTTEVIPGPYDYGPEGFLRVSQRNGVAEAMFEHGLNAPDMTVSEAVLTLAKTHLVRGPITDRATQIPVDAGGVINLATPGLLGSWFGIPEVDAVATDNRLIVIA